jgi:tetratricopeptide (TPR) repeat protein
MTRLMIWLLLLPLLTTAAQDASDTVGQLLYQGLFEQAGRRAIHVMSTNSRFSKADSLVSIIDSLFTLSMVLNEKYVPPDSNQPKGTVQLEFNSTFAHSPEMRLTQISLWIAYANRYPKGPLSERFQSNIMWRATPTFDSTKMALAREMTLSKNLARRLDAFTYLGYSAHAAGRFDLALDFYSKLSAHSEDPQSRAKFELFSAECAYWLNRFDDALRRLDNACVVVASDPNSPVCRMRPYWKIDFERARNDPHSARVQHVFITFH